ncbi:hypothetical protein [Actinoplanes aureus]|uniref:Uncharacterized protein n=1 Tax=Actinoplanes aureus TaxID=2792083 RepID=A0A931CIM7_9ACTN|nr:hypothetical protein [Actinoplanes aureus]MBG0567816.1 hypothetical protein [Actinoplanes aureus]
MAAVHRARAAVLAGRSTVAGVPIAAELVSGWAGVQPVALRTLYRAFAAEVTPAAAAAASDGDRARRSKLVYLRRRPPGATRCGRATTRTCRFWCCRRAGRRSRPG